MIHYPFRYPLPTEIIRLAVMMCVRFSLSLSNAEDLLHEWNLDSSCETVQN